MKKRPIIGLLCITLVNQPEYKELDLELEHQIMNLGMDLIAFTPYGIRWPTKTVHGKALVNGEWVQTEMLFPDVIYNRLYGTHPNTIRRLSKLLGSELIFNRTNRLDKYQVYQALLGDHKKILPCTSEYTWEGLLDSLTNYKEIVLKPKQGHYGLDIYRVSRVMEDCYYIYQDRVKPPQLKLSKKELEKFIVEIQKGGKREYLIQELIDPAVWKGRYFDVRTLVQKDHLGIWRVTAMISRVARRNYFATNVIYKLEHPEKLLGEVNHRLIDKIKMHALQAAKSLSSKIGPFGELGIDFLIDRRGDLWLIEINGKPIKDLFAVVRDERILEKVYLRPLEYAKFLAQKN